MISQNVDNLNSQVPYSTYSEPSQYMQFESDTFTPYMPAETSLSSSSIVHKQSSPKKDASEQVIEDVHNTEMTTAIHYKDDIVSDQNKEYSPFENIATSINLRDLSTSALASSAVNFFDNESFNVSLEINKKIENLNINDSTTSACTDTHKHDIDGLTKGESDVDNGQGSLTISTQDVPSKIQNNLSCDHNTIEYDYTQHGDLQDPLNDSANVEAVTDTSKNLFDGNEPHRHICATMNPIWELNTNKNFEVLEDLLEYSNTLTEKSQSSSELNICETCREVNKPGEGEKEVDDLTAQLIENITSPIQLSNPVVALLTDSRTPVDDTSDLDSRQCAEISHMTEETIEIIHAKTATELLDNVDIEPINNPDVLNYGWSTEKNALKLIIENSLSSPTLPFEAGSPSMPFRIPPGFEEEYKRKLGMMSLQNTLNQSDDLDKNIVCIPDTTTQTHHTIVTTYSHISNMSKEITNTSNMSEEVMVHSSIKTNPIAKDPPTTTNIPQLLQIPAVITDRDVTYTEVTLTSSLFDASTQNPKPVAEVETEISKMLPRTLPVQATLFSSKQEKPPEDPDNNISFNRLASYFAAPAKTEPGKSFF
ncbi:hypothetical protein ACJJTC_001889 [Scirpophaga incertulas]